LITEESSELGFLPKVLQYDVLVLSYLKNFLAFLASKVYGAKFKMSMSSLPFLAAASLF